MAFLQLRFLFPMKKKESLGEYVFIVLGMGPEVKPCTRCLTSFLSLRSLRFLILLKASLGFDPSPFSYAVLSRATIVVLVPRRLNIVSGVPDSACRATRLQNP